MTGGRIGMSGGGSGYDQSGGMGQGGGYDQSSGMAGGNSDNYNSGMYTAAAVLLLFKAEKIESPCSTDMHKLCLCHQDFATKSLHMIFIPE